MDRDTLTLIAVTAAALLLFGTLYGLMVLWLHRQHYQRITAVLLVTSPIGVAVPIIAAAPFAGLPALAWVFGALGVASLPLCVIVGWELLERARQGDLDL